MENDEDTSTETNKQRHTFRGERESWAETEGHEDRDREREGHEEREREREWR